MKTSRRFLCAVYAVLILCGFNSLLVAQTKVVEADNDRDGLPDGLEQSLLEKFRPTFLISADECDVAPAEFQPGQKIPIVVRRNGTIYGQAFRATTPTASSGVLVELHYYHLWGRDCGRMGHRLDAEHVSVLVKGGALDSPIEDWLATHWYAAAHEDTVCDASSGAKAATLHAERSGTKVWISRGKHASFLSEEECRHGCGADRCEQMKELPRAALINVGEVNAPLNGAIWTSSPSWQISQKFHPDFNAAMIAEIDAQGDDAIVHLSAVPSPVRSVIGAGGAGIGGVGVGNEHAGSALAVATKKTKKSLGKSYRAVKKSLGGGSGEKPKQ